MAKQDVLDAINATIAPNNIKGITAESLNNVLTLMTENAGEGGCGDGALRVIVPDMVLLGPEVLSMGELSPVSWEEMKSLLEQDGVDSSEYDAVVKASFEHNANVAQQIIEKAREGKGVSVVLDQTPFLSAFIELQSQMDPSYSDMIEEAAMLGVQPAGVDFQYMKPTPAGESMVGGEFFDCSLIPTGYINDTNTGAINYPSTAIIHLNLDGSLLFEMIEEEQPSSGNGVVTFYFDPTIGGFTEEKKAKNAESYASFFDMGGECSVILKTFALPETILTSPCLTMGVAEDGLALIVLDTDITDTTSGFSKITYVVSSDGSITVQQ